MAGTGEEAIIILKEKPHDVVVLDVNMPGMDGHEALSQIKDIDPETQVIMLTGHGTPDSAKESLIRNAFDYLNKPCDIDILCSKINEAYAAKHHGEPRKEKTARDIMIHIEDYTTVTVNDTVRETIQKLMQCASCQLRCVMCGLYLDTADTATQTNFNSGFAFCKTCSEEFEDFLAQSRGEKHPAGPYWHNEEWEKMWAAWLDYRQALRRFASSHEYKRLLKELRTQL